MITLYAFGPAFGMRDPSPFVMKAEILLKMAGLPYAIDVNGFKQAPKGKLPYIDDGDDRIPDSTLIRWHLERKYGIDFDRGLSTEERAIAWSFEKMAEDHFYWTLLDARWTDDSNFAKGPLTFFRKVPVPMRQIVVAMVRRQVRRGLHEQGMGRHSPAEIVALGTRSIDATADFLADKPFFMGQEPTGVDAAIFSFVAGILCPHFDTPLREAAERHGNLRRYVGTMTARYYPDPSEIAGKRAA